MDQARNDERRAAFAQMMAENREGLGMKVIAVMVQRYGVLPKYMWDLNSISDMGAGRGVTYNEDFPQAMLENILSNKRYSILNLTLGKDVSQKVDVELPNTLRRLEIMSLGFDFPLDLPSSLLELIFHRNSQYNQPLVLPAGLRKIILGYCFNRALNLPPPLVELELGAKYSQPLALPQRLKRLTFPWLSEFNLPITLPPSIKSVLFGKSYNQPTILPPGIEEIGFRPSFTHDVSLPNSLRRIEWWCGRPIEIPHGVTEVDFADPFDHPVFLPDTLKKVLFDVGTYSHAITFPEGLEELEWYPDAHGLMLPERLQKLSYWSNMPVTLPAGLKEIVIGSEAPLVLPEGLLQVTFHHESQGHYSLPHSVRKVNWSGSASFTHPTTLQHLIMEYNPDEVDLSHIKVHKLTVEYRSLEMKKWPQELKELEFTVDDMNDPLRVPEGCRIVGERLPANVILE